jgi:hypothetical protein
VVFVCNSGANLQTSFSNAIGDLKKNRNILKLFSNDGVSALGTVILVACFNQLYLKLIKQNILTIISRPLMKGEMSFKRPV